MVSLSNHEGRKIQFETVLARGTAARRGAEFERPVLLRARAPAARSHSEGAGLDPPVMSPKKRKNSLSGDSTIVVSSSPRAAR